MLVLLLKAGTIVGQSLVPPQLNCLEVVADDVNISWTKPEVIPANFSHYELAISANNVNFVNFEVINDYNTESFYDANGSADNGPIYYFMRSVNLAGETSEHSDTLSSIFLNLNGQSFIAPIAEMNWNSLYSENALDTANGFYSIQQNFGMGWVESDTTGFGNESFSELINVCHGQDDSVLVSYRIQISHPSGCVSTSYERNGKYQDVNPPSLPQIETVSVDSASNNAVVCWYSSPEGDVQNYMIQEIAINGLDTVPIATLGNTTFPTELSFEHLNSNADEEVEFFIVIPRDSCLHSGNTFGNTGAIPNPTNYMAGTMYLESELDRCERKVTLTWNPYVHWDEGVLGYEILASENGGQYQLVGTRGPNGTEFSIADLNIDAQYCFLVKAISNGIQKDSFTNSACIEIEYPERSDIAYISNVSVLDDRSIELTAFHAGGEGMKYDFQKYDPSFNDYFSIGTVTYDPLMGQDVQFIDNLNAPINSALRYRVGLIDSCDVAYLNSIDGRNVILRVVANSNESENNLVWTKYVNWDGDVQGYNIYRGNRGEAPSDLIATLPPWRTDYSDDVSEFINIQGEFCYYVEAVENFNSLGIAKNSFSNQECGTQKPIFWIPNAIVMGGVNEEFKPSGGFLNIENYSLLIYNRWGQEIFESTDFETGWKGFYQGEPVPQGVYFYYIRYQGGDGTVFEQRGDVYFINGL